MKCDACGKKIPYEPWELHDEDGEKMDLFFHDECLEEYACAGKIIIEDEEELLIVSFEEETSPLSE